MSKYEINHPRYRGQHGATPLQYLLFAVLALGGIALGFQLYNQGSASSKAMTIVQNNASLRAAVTAWSGNRPVFTGVSASQVVKTKKLPSNLIDAAGTGIQTDYGPVTIAAASVNGGTDNAYTMTYAAIPTSICDSLVKTAAEDAAAIVVGTSTVKDATTTFDTATATNACNAATQQNVALTYTGS